MSERCKRLSTLRFDFTVLLPIVQCAALQDRLGRLQPEERGDAVARTGMASARESQAGCSHAEAFIPASVRAFDKCDDTQGKVLPYSSDKLPSPFLSSWQHRTKRPHLS